MDKSGGVEFLRVWIVKELQEKMRFEIVVLGIQFGKVNIVVWVVRDEKYLLIFGSRFKDVFEVEYIWIDVVVIKVVVMEEVEKVKFNLRCSFYLNNIRYVLLLYYF